MSLQIVGKPKHFSFYQYKRRWLRPRKMSTITNLRKSIVSSFTTFRSTILCTSPVYPSFARDSVTDEVRTVKVPILQFSRLVFGTVSSTRSLGPHHER